MEKIFEPGAGGTPEILNWFTALGSVGAGAHAKILWHEPVPAWATGVAYAFLPLPNREATTRRPAA